MAIWRCLKSLGAWPCSHAMREGSFKPKHSEELGSGRLTATNWWVCVTCPPQRIRICYSLSYHGWLLSSSCCSLPPTHWIVGTCANKWPICPNLHVSEWSISASTSEDLSLAWTTQTVPRAEHNTGVKVRGGESWALWKEEEEKELSCLSCAV